MSPRLLRSAGFLCLGLGLAGPALASPTLVASLPGLHGLELTPVVVFGRNSRETVAQFATAEGLKAADVRDRHAASGIVQCGDAHGAGQLTLADNVVTTAAHVLFDEAGAPRAETCVFKLVLGDGREIHVPIDSSTIVAGSRDPYAVDAVHDWAIVKLKKPIDGPQPYRIADHVGLGPVEFVARGHVDWGNSRQLSLEKCQFRKQLAEGAEGTREFSFDCETGNGASGGAVLSGEVGGELMAVLVGYRSISPSSALPFSGQHYNFVVSVEGAFRDAARKAAAPPDTLTASAGVKTASSPLPALAQDARSAVDGGH
jgi:hypothetical protein